MTKSAREVIDALGLAPHPEGGWYRETWRAPPGADGRSLATAIHFLLERGQRSHWHRIDATELWLHQGGGTLRLEIERSGDVDVLELGSGVGTGAVDQAVVPPGAWQSASTEAPWSLVACVVVPGFRFSGFELAPPDWHPGAALDPIDALDRAWAQVRRRGPSQADPELRPTPQSGTRPTNLAIRMASVDDEAAVVELWRVCGLVTVHNDPIVDFRRAGDGPASGILVGTDDGGRVVGTVMVGHDGHRGWLYYVAAHPDLRGQGIGREMVQAGETWLRTRGVPKVHLMVRESNADVVGFYDHLGFEDMPRVLMSKWLTEPPKP